MAFIGIPGDSSSSTTLAAPPWIYDVFLSFHGKDTRKGFIDHLYSALRRKGIITFKDDEKLKRGEYISEELLKAIEKSRYAIVVISKRYAFSKWCLIELTKILKCREQTRMTVLPVFYYVDPSHARKQEGSFAEAFAKHNQNTEVDEEQRKMWRVALKDIGNLSGWHINDRHEAAIIEDISRFYRHEAAIVEDISRKILDGVYHTPLNISERLVGIGFRASKLISLLKIGSDNVHFIGICGMGGIGKSTLAKVIYDRVSLQFEARCFIETQNQNLVHLQTKLICEILKESGLNVLSNLTGMDMIARAGRNKNAFIVIDNVDTEDQLKALAKCHDWFGRGSRIIVTSRDRQLLNQYMDDIYDVMELSANESLELFCWKAFKKDHPEENYVKFSKNIVHYAQGLPLALEVFGSSLFRKKINVWEAAQEQLKANMNKDILKRLQISYEILEDSQKKLFLDIACLFEGNPEKYHQKLKCLHSYLEFDIEVLKDRCLIKYLWGQLRMHDLLKKMGQQIVYDESPNEPGRRSRLWNFEDIAHVLNDNTGIDAVEGITFESSSLPMELSVEGFSKMNKLKILVCGNQHYWYGDFSNFRLSNELRYLQFVGYPSQSLPINFKPRNLVSLEVPYSCIHQWYGLKGFNKLTFIDMSFSHNLIEIPDFSGIPNLKELDLQYCINLSKVHSSLGVMKRLEKLDLEGCQSLKNLPEEISMESLTYFNLAGCSRLTNFPNIVGNMTSLKFLDLIGTDIKMLPLSFQSLSSIESLNLCGCLRNRTTIEMEDGHYIMGGSLIIGLLDGSFVTQVCGYFWGKYGRVYDSIGVLDIEGGGLNLSSLWHLNFFLRFNSLKALDLSFLNLSDVDIPNAFSCLSSIESLNLSGNKFTRIPVSVSELPNLTSLHLSYCTKLQTLSEPLLSRMSVLRRLNLSYCDLSDGMIPKCLNCLSLLEALSLVGNKFRRIPNLVQLSSLYYLYLNNCTQLETLPKLPWSLYWLELRNCQSLDICYVEGVKELINNSTSLIVHIDHDGRPYMILKESSGQRANSGLEFKGTVNYSCKFVCSASVSRIPDWFNQRVSNSFEISIESCFFGCALLIHYQVRELGTFEGQRKKPKLHEYGNSNYEIFDGDNHTPPSFLCHFQNNELGTKASLLLYAPETPSSGQNAFWGFISPNWFYKLVNHNGLDILQKGCLDVSIESCYLNVEMECWVRGAYWGAYRNDLPELAGIISDISPQHVDSKMFQKLFRPNRYVAGPIKYVKSHSMV